MNIERELKKRSNEKCELCASTEKLNSYQVPPVNKNTTLNKSIYACSVCIEQIEYPEKTNTNH